MAIPKRDLITEEEFNRKILQGRQAPRPEDDSPGDTADEEEFETELGEEYGANGEEEDLDDRPVPADFHGGAKAAPERGLEEGRGRAAGVESSPRPDPRQDRDSGTSTH